MTDSHTHNYTQGHSASTTASHASRTIYSDASFLVPHLKPTDKILDVGCGPGTITVGFLSLVPQGSVIGTDYSANVLEQARQIAEKEHSDALASSQLQFQQGDVLQRLPYDDDTFDVVFSSQLFPHLPGPELPVKALREMRRVVKPGGIVATRDAAVMSWYPLTEGLKLFQKYMIKAVGQVDWPGPRMAGHYRRAGFDVDGGKLQIGAGSVILADLKGRQWWSRLQRKKLTQGDEFRDSWKKIGVTDEEIELVIKDLEEWAKTPDAWYGLLQSEIIATK